MMGSRAKKRFLLGAILVGCGGKVDDSDSDGGVPPDGFKCGPNICKKGVEYCFERLGPRRGAPRTPIESYDCKSLPAPATCERDTCICPHEQPSQCY